MKQIYRNAETDTAGGTSAATQGVAAATAKPKAEVEKVTMKDGRVVEFPGKRRMQKDNVIDGEKVGVRFDFRNGETLMSWVPTHLLQYAAAHGWGQKLGDQPAGLKAEDGSPADIEDIFLAVEELNTRLQEPASNWNEVREGAVGVGGTSLLLKALIEVTQKTVEDVKAFLKDLKPAEKVGLRNDPEIAPIIKRLEAEKAAKVGAGAVEAAKSKLMDFRTKPAAT